MNKQEKLAALDGVDIDSLHGSTKSKKIAKLFVQGVAYKEIAEVFGLSVTRISQVTDKQARIAKFYKDRSFPS